ncbi:Phytoene/squalene synthetase [Corynebacterium mycetoides]|uniref:Phytoene/squalene synthetase n=1 Tax=Corynebacterium mycetoides TaxID=38302 RepID=A0A1G9LJ21_9CORY|nr:squalene/phytoene synthase family protein [Corynebacterium mycetoides]SDL61931.1 Phytoene/squalene synthetase [Corynebacterium mycetoides]
MESPRALALYDRMCDRAAAQVIAQYSTSFSLATRFLAPRVRTDIRNLYAMVRIADEIVDGAAGSDAAPLLDAYEAQVLAAPATRFHTDPVIHAWANSARRCRFDDAHVTAFFDSMRRDVTQFAYTPADFDAYVYGSAEVIGLMCVAAFVAQEPVSAADRAELDAGARALGAAFQKVNFLRDLAEDRGELGRAYFPELDAGELTSETKAALVADIRRDLERARRAIPLIPGSARGAVAAAEALFSELATRIDAAPAATVTTTRISVPRHRKLYVTARALRRSRAR